MQKAHPETIWLAIETSGRAGSIAVARGGADTLPGSTFVGQASCLSGSRGLLHLLAEEDLPAQRRHNVELFPVIARTFERLGLRPGELTHVAVSAGPGSFTALRIGIVAARTLAQATGAKLVAVPTFEALAWTVFSSRRDPHIQPPNAQKPDQESHAAVLTLSNAKRGHVFGEVWGENAKTPKRRNAEMEGLLPDAVWFAHPTEDRVLSPLPEGTLRMIRKPELPVMLKKRIVEKNARNHPELSAQDSVEILRAALYGHNLAIHNKPKTKPNYWMLVKTNGKHRSMVVEFNVDKRQYEIVNWHYLRDESLALEKKRAEQEGGQVLVTENQRVQGAAGLSALQPGSLSSITPKPNEASADLVWETAIGHRCDSPPPSPHVPRPSSLVTRPSLLVTYSSLIPLAEYDLTELLTQTPRPLRAAGEAVREHADVLRAAGVDVSEPVIERPTASAVLAVAADKVRTQGEAAYCDLHQLEPIYVRLAEAEEKWRAAHGTTDKHR